MAPAPLLLSGDRPVRDHDMHDITVDHGTVLAERGTVSIRLAMDHRDDVRGPVEPNLEHHDWSWFIPGELVAGAVASAVDDALDTAMAWPDAGIRVDERTTVLWRYRDASQPAAHAAGLRSGPVRASRMVRLARAGGLADARAAGPADPVAVATARLVATEALSCGSDLPFTLSAETHLRIAWPESGAGTPSLVTMTLVRVESDEPDVLEVLAPLELLRDELRAGFDSRLDSRPAGAMATDQGSGALRIDTERPVTAPMTRAWIGIVASAELGAGGMLVAGPLALRQPGELGARPRRGHEWAVLRGERDRGSHNGDRPDEPGGNGSVLA
jgi:hypothetical protein